MSSFTAATPFPSLKSKLYRQTIERVKVVKTTLLPCLGEEGKGHGYISAKSPNGSLLCHHQRQQLIRLRSD